MNNNKQIQNNSEFAKQVILSINGISRLCQNDKKLFRFFFKKGETSYSSSWLYMLRATRGDYGEIGYKYLCEGFLIGIGIRKGTIYLIRPMGEIKYETIQWLCRELTNALAMPIIIRKIDGDLHSNLLTNLGQEFIKPDQKNTPLDLEDDLYPEQVINLKKIFTNDFSINNDANKLIRKIKRFNKQESCITAFWWQENSVNPYMIDAINVLAKGNIEKKTAYYPMINEGLLKQTISDNYQLCIFMDKKKIVGFYLGEDIGDGKFGLYCALSSADSPGITEWLDVYFFKVIKNMGFRLINIGGSETKGVYNYVEKFLPETAPNKMYCLIYHPV